jgi:N-acetylmuramoyl-L-alanine amidase
MLALAEIFGSGALLADGELARALAAREKFFQNPSGGSRRSEWLALIREFEHAADVQPRPEPAARGRYHAADLAWRSWRKFSQKPDLRTAVSLARRSLKGCSRCPEAPAALVVLGRALAAQGSPEEAYRELMKVELNYRAPEEAREARALMDELAGRQGAGSRRAAADSPGGQNSPGAPGPNPPGARSGSAAAPAGPAASKSVPAAPPKRRDPPEMPAPRADGRAQLAALYLDDLGPYTEITAYLDRVTPYVYNMLPPSEGSGRFRIYVDFRETRLARGGRLGVEKVSPLVQVLKASQLDDETVRMVADLPAAHPYTPVFLDNPPRMIIRVAREASELPPVEAEDPPGPREQAAPAQSRAKPAPPPARGPADSMARQLGLGIRRVAVDAGHGGKDGGAAGHGLKEKDITLKAARMLAKKIRERLGLEVVLTRDSDVFVTLDRRTRTAREKKADLFVSLHVNANDLAKVEGFESYVLNFTSDPTAMAVAARENASSGKTMSEMEDVLKKIARNTKTAESRVLARAVHGGALASVRQKHKVRDLGVKEAAFVVLANVDVPSVLVEMGFITNKNDAEKLAQDKYLELITDGICDGLKAYLAGLQ